MTASVPLHAQISGDSAAPPVILLHGLFGMSDNLGALAKALQDHYAVYRLDLRNHGRSAWSQQMSLALMAEDVAAFCLQHKLQRAALFGHSLGGKVAMQVALTQPQLVSALVVADIAPVTYAPHHNDILQALAQLETVQITSRQQADQLLANTVADSFVRQFVLKNLYRDEAGRFAWRMNVPVLINQYEQLRLAPQGDAFAGPCLFIKGELSAYIQQKHMPAITELFPAAQFKMIQGAGHFLHSEKPVAFNHLVKRFLDSHCLA